MPQNFEATLPHKIIVYLKGMIINKKSAKHATITKENAQLWEAFILWDTSKCFTVFKCKRPTSTFSKVFHSEKLIFISKPWREELKKIANLS